MKRTLSVLGFSLLSLGANAIEFGPPFSQLDIDRALPEIDFPPVGPRVADRALPTLRSPDVPFAGAAAAGGTVTDAPATDTQATEEPSAESTWARDYFRNNPPE